MEFTPRISQILKILLDSLSELKADYPRFARMHHKSSILS